MDGGQVGFKIIDVELTTVNGGSFSLMIGQTSSVPGGGHLGGDHTPQESEHGAAHAETV
jgi:hypothetical protein